MEIRVLQKNGSSCCVNLPSKMLRTLGWTLGDYVGLKVVMGGLLEIKKVNHTHGKEEPCPKSPPFQPIG